MRRKITFRDIFWYRKPAPNNVPVGSSHGRLKSLDTAQNKSRLDYEKDKGKEVIPKTVGWWSKLRWPKALSQSKDARNGNRHHMESAEGPDAFESSQAPAAGTFFPQAQVIRSDNSGIMSGSS